MRLSSTALFFVSLLTIVISAPINDVVIEARGGEEVAREPIPLLKREAQGAPLWKRNPVAGSATWKREAEAGVPVWRRDAEAAEGGDSPGWRREAEAGNQPGWRREAEAGNQPGWRREAAPASGSPGWQ